MKTYVLYHGNCPDGAGAALAAWTVLGNDAEYIPVSYGKPPPEMERGSRVYIVDFSYSKKVLYDLMESHQITVIDHHETARQELDGCAFAIFDMNKSGAVLTWEHFRPGHPIPLFFEYLQDRDLWRFKLEKSREVSAAMGLYPFTLESFVDVYEQKSVNDLIAEGEVCLRLKNQQVENMTKHHRWAYLDPKAKKIRFTEKLEPGGNGDPVVPEHIEIMPVANATVFFSEVGERLLELYPSMDCAAYYTDRSDGKRQWGLRSRPGFDCSVIAKAFGGGGHKQASGFVEG